MATLLLVDDDPTVLTFCHRVLSGIGGMTVLDAGSGPEALNVACQYRDAIHVLLSDIVMPGALNGVQLAEKITAIRPGIAVLLMSGSNPRDYLVKPSWRFLAKPFVPEALISNIKALLSDAPWGQARSYGYPSWSV